MERPTISSYSDIAKFVGDMLAYRKSTERHFSVLRNTKKMRRVSPALVSLIVAGKRRVTSDRVGELAKLLALTGQEGKFFADWVARVNGEQPELPHALIPESTNLRRKSVGTHLLMDWINVYVKDAFQIEAVGVNPEKIFALLAGVASQSRIEKSIAFLKRHGYLRVRDDGKISPEIPVHSIDQQVPSAKVREFHKAALSIAMKAIDAYGPSQRYANALIIPLKPESYTEIVKIIQETSERLQRFAETNEEGDALYQIVINLSPTGGRHE